MVRRGIAGCAGEGGFTLLELLVALTVLSFLTVLLFDGLRFGASAWERGRDDVDEMDSIRSVQEFLRRELTQAYPSFIVTDPTHKYVEFDGREDRLSFMAPAPAALEAGGMARLVLFQRANALGRQLVVSWRPELAVDNRKADNAATETVLLRGMTQVQLAYFGASRDGEAGTWRSQWTGGAILPQLVRLRVEFADKRRSWPEFIVAPRISVDIDCTFDSLTRKCRGR